MERQTHPALSVLSPFDLAFEYRENPDQNFQGDSHYALQICFVLNGQAEMMMEKFNGVYEKGDIWWNMCWEPHAYRLAGKRNFIMAVNLDAEQLGACGPFGGCNWLIPFIVKPLKRYKPKTAHERQIILSFGKRLYRLYKTKNTHWQISAWLLIHELLLFVINSMAAGDKPVSETGSPNAFTRLRVVLNHVWGADKRPPNLSEAAKLCGLSSSRFSELFRQTMGVSYGKFALRVRMSNASKDLLSGKFSLEEISQKWSFFDSAHFCHTFKKYYRISPGQFINCKTK